MTTKLLLAAAFVAGLLDGGCLIVPSTKTTSKPLGIETGNVVKGPAIEVSLKTAAIADEITVTATRRQRCTRDLLAVSSVTTTRGARSGGARDPRARVFGVLLAPLTIPVSAIYTGLVVATSGRDTQRVTKLVRNETFECTSVAAELAVRLTLPSGAYVDGKTDADGKLALALPVTEPYRGTVIATAALAKPARVDYAQPVPPLRAVRDVVTACAAQHHVDGSIIVKLMIDAYGAVARTSHERAPNPATDALVSCVDAGLTSVRFAAQYRNTTLQLPFTLPSA